MALSFLALLAQQTGPAPTTAPGTAQQPPTMWPMLIGLMLFFAVFMVLNGKARRKEQRERQKLLDNLGKNDRIMTIGGIIGTVVTVRDNEVVVKVDETTNAKMTFIKKAIQQVLPEGTAPPVDKQ